MGTLLDLFNKKAYLYLLKTNLIPFLRFDQ